MGFGYVLVGYFFANIMGTVHSVFGFAQLVGYPLMLVGFRKLAAYQRGFLKCFYLSFAALPFSVYRTYLSLIAFGVPFPEPLAGFAAAVDWIYFAFFLLLEGLWLLSVGALSAELSFPKTQSAAYRNMIFVGLYALIYLVTGLPFVAQTQASKYFVVPFLLLRTAALFLNLWLLYLCYRNICPAEEEQLSFEEIKPDKKGGK